MEITYKQKFKGRREINNMLGSDIVKGISLTKNNDAIVLILNDEELYSDYFYPKNTYDYCMYTGIGRYGHQDSLQNNMYDRNMAVLTHKKDKRTLLVFDRDKNNYIFAGQYELIETHQNVQPDDNHELRRVFVFHLKQISNTYKF